MEKRPDLKYQRILENVRQYFDFLFGRGFRIASVIFADQDYENWQITLTTDDYLIEIYSYAGIVNVALSTLQLYKTVGLFELIDLIYLINGEASLSGLQAESPTNETQRFQKIAWLLETYIDEVLREIEMIPILPPIDHSSNKKSGRLSKGNRPDFRSKVGKTTSLFFDFSFDYIIAAI